MTKNVILELIEYRKKLEESHLGDQNKNRNKDLLDIEIPDIPTINENLQAIKKELQQLKATKQKAIDYVKSKKKAIEKIKCTHPLIYTSQGGGFGVEESYKPRRCILCRKKLTEKKSNTVELKDSFYDEERLIKNYNFSYLYPLIKEILKKYNSDEEVDLNEEFLNLFKQDIIGEVKINGIKYKRTYKILMIGGSINNKSNKELLTIIEHMNNIPRINLEVVISQDIEYPRSKEEFNTLEDLKNILKEKAKNKYDLIIDLTNILEFQIVNGEIKANYKQINFEELFPDTTIIKGNNENKITAFDNLFKNNESLTQDIKRLIL